MRCQHQHLGYLHVCRGARCVIHHIGYVIASQWLDTLIYLVRTFLVAAETSYAEVGLHQSWFHIRYA